MKPSVFEYSDYREFLKSYYSFAKESKRHFSHRKFAKKAGFATSNFLYLVMTGKRNLSMESVPGFAGAMELSKKEQHYFETLVSFNQAKTPQSKRYYLELLYGLKNPKIGATLNDDHFEFLANWHCSVIREMVMLHDFREDPFWIRKMLGERVPARRIRAAIDNMLKSGLLKRDERGRLVQADAHLATEAEVKSTAIVAFHQQMLELARDILGASSNEAREISGVTMAVSKKQFAEVKRMVQDFEHQVALYLGSNPDIPEAVYQLNMQLFPVAGELKGDKNE